MLKSRIIVRRGLSVLLLAPPSAALACGALLGITDVPDPSASDAGAGDTRYGDDRPLADGSLDAMTIRDSGADVDCGANFATDMHNCGRCGRDCAGGGCQSGECLPIQILTPASNLKNLGPIRAANGNVCFTSPMSPTGAVYCSKVDGTGLATIASAQNNPQGVAVDATQVYWTTSTPTAGVNRAHFDGTSANALVTTSMASDVAVDGSYVYWLGSNAVNQAPIGGGASSMLVSGQLAPTRIALDSTRLYWGNSMNGAVMSSLLNGTGEGAVAVASISYPLPVTSDGTYVYWTLPSQGKVQSAKLPASPAILIATTASAQGADGVAVDGTYVYWTDSDDGHVWRALAPNGAPERIVSTTSINPSGITLDETSLYWTESTSFASVWRMVVR